MKPAAAPIQGARGREGDVSTAARRIRASPPQAQPLPDLGAAALAYVRRGWAVLPLAGKVPRVKHGVHGASTDPEVITAWWRRWPSANVGIRCDGLLVLDIDGAEGERGLDLLQLDHGRLPATAEVLTGRGRHLYFKLPAGAVARNRPLAPEIDVRTGSGAYTVAPPSRHASGVTYRWAGARTIAPAPPWLLALVAPSPLRSAQPAEPPRNVSSYVRAAVDAELGALARAVKPGRNIALNKAAFCLFQLTKGGLLTEDWARAELIRIARDIGLPDRRILPTIDSAWRAAQPRTMR